MGDHAGESPNEIFQRKMIDIERVGQTFWLVKSRKSQPESVARLCKENQAYVIFVAASGLLSIPLLAAFGLASTAHAAPRDIAFLQSAQVIQAYDFVEVTINLEGPDAPNPFMDVVVSGTFSRVGQTETNVEGFCDSADGRLYRIRFMPASPGEYSYSVTFEQGKYHKEHHGVFRAVDAGRRGVVRVDPEYPFHFIWEGTGEHYFYNGTTAYWLLGYRDDAVIREVVERLARLKINRIRIALSARTKDGGRWKEDQVKPDAGFQFRIEPWPAARPENIEDPGYDVSRFQLETFRKCERLLRYARGKDLVVSIVFRLDAQDPGVDPFGMYAPGNEDEQRYYRYAVARLSAFSNVMWDVTNEWHLSRKEPWVEQFGGLIKAHDPWGHLTSVHGKGVFPASF